jgi:hypothetical protein
MLKKHRLTEIGGVALALWLISRILQACGPFWTQLDTVQKIEPPYKGEYKRGELGVVRPLFARRYLLQAFRVFGG